MADPLGTAVHDIKSVAYGVAKFLVVDDWNKMTDAKAPTWERVLAGVSLASNFVGPEGRALTAVAKPVLMHAAESLAEHGAADALKKLIERGGAAELGEAARYLRAHATELGRGAQAAIESLEHTPAVSAIFAKARSIGHDIAEAGTFVENVLTKSSLVPSLRHLGNDLEKSPAILAAAAFAQRNTIDTLLGNTTLPSLPGIVDGTKQIAHDMLEAGKDVRNRGERLLGRVERGAADLADRIGSTYQSVFGSPEPQLHVFRNGRPEILGAGFHERGRLSVSGDMVGITAERDGKPAVTMIPRNELMEAMPPGDRPLFAALLRTGGTVDIALSEHGATVRAAPAIVQTHEPAHALAPKLTPIIGGHDR